MIDSHHHLWNYSAAEYPWIPPGTPLAQNQLLTELETACRSAAVDATVVVQARQSLAESDWLLSLADQSPLIQGVVGWVPLTEPDVLKPLTRLASHPKFKAVRHVLQDEPDAYFLRQDFHRGLALLPALGLRYDLLCFQRQLPLAISLVDQQADLGIIIDHLAKPEIRNGKINPAWKAGMTELAKRDNVLGVKISGLVTEVLDPKIDPSTLRAYFDEALALFGPQRLIFGSDWPVCLLRVSSYQTWATAVRDFVSHLTLSEQRAILHDNAARCYNLAVD